MSKLKFIVLFMFIFGVFACSVGFQGSDHYKKRTQLNSKLHNAGNSDDAEVNSENDSAPIVAQNEDSVQKLFDDAKAKKDELFAAASFENWTVWFTELNNDGTGKYKFGEEGSWKDNGHYKKYDKNHTCGAVSYLCYYRYDDRIKRWQESNKFNPFAAGDSDGKLAEREKRFYFYRFTGSASGFALDNSMFCVDTYTKFLWVYSEPSWEKHIIGSNYIPQDWVDYDDPKLTENHKKAYGKFYLYDPVGYVEKDGNIVIYEWYKSMVRKRRYSPSQGFVSPAERDPDKPGHSPYLPTDNIEFNPVGVNIRLKSVRNVDVQSWYWLLSWKKMGYAWLSYAGKVSPKSNAGYTPLVLKALRGKATAGYEKVKVDTAVSTDASVTIQLSDIVSDGAFGIDTALWFANCSGWLPGASKVELMKGSPSVLSFEYVPKKDSNSACVTCKGLNSSNSAIYSQACNITQSEEKVLTDKKSIGTVKVVYKKLNDKGTTPGTIEVIYELSWKLRN